MERTRHGRTHQIQADALYPGEVGRDDMGELLMRLETERQEVLGKLSFMTVKDPHYKELDRRFNELTQEINGLKRVNNV